MSDAPDLLHDISVVSFGGIPCAQMWIDFIFWENLLNDNPQLLGIFEIGTWQGGFSWYLYSQARARQIGFWTVDVIEPDKPHPRFEKMDVWAEVEPLHKRFKEMGPIALFCDGGNKPRELATFAPMCAPDSIFVVHDWGTEMLSENVPADLEELYGSWCDTVGSMTRVFRAGERPGDLIE